MRGGSGGSLEAIQQAAAALGAELEARIDREHPGLLSTFPVNDYLRALEESGPYRGYRHVPSLARSWCARIAERSIPCVLERYHQLVLLHLMSVCAERSSGLRLPSSVTRLLDDAFRQVLDRLKAAEERYFLHENDLFAKDLAVCRLKLLPCGSELVDRSSGVPRSILLRGGLPQLARGARFFLGRAKGFRPWYESHWDRRLIRLFTRHEYDRSYVRMAELLALNPGIKGVMSASWWFDPMLESISPNLAFLRKVPQEHGAELFRVGEDAAATHDATRLSAERTRLYQAGAYRPTVYLLAWLREDMLSFAKQLSAQSAAAASS